MDALNPLPLMPESARALGMANVAVPPVAPNPNDLQAFTNAMADSASGVADTAGTKAVSTQGAFDSFAGLNFDPTLRGKTGMPMTADQAPALGDAILQGIRKASGSYQSQLSNLRMDLQALGTTPGPMAPQSLLKMQVNLMQLDMHLNIASKIANKLSQGVQTLFKNQ